MRGIVRSVRADVLVLAIAACSPAANPAPVASPELDVPRLDGGVAEPVIEGVRFGRMKPSVGARWQVRVSATSATADPQGGMQTSEYVSVFTVEVLGTNGPAPSQVRLDFEKNVHRYQGVDTPTVIDGKAYILDTNVAPDGPGRSPVRTESGAAPSAEEIERVLDVFPDIGTRTQIDQVLPDAAMKIGEARDELARAILRVIHPRAWTLNAGSAVLARTEGDDAVFAVSIDATGSNGLRMAVKGETNVRLRDARLMRIALDGTYDLATPGRSDPGTFSLRRTVTDLGAEPLAR